MMNIRIDKSIKAAASAVAEDVGLPLSSVIVAQLREFIRTRQITFSSPPDLKDSVKSELIVLSADARKGSNISPKFNDLQSAFDWLDK
jgi:addiction module RelB/DinJ family antitoxin